MEARHNAISIAGAPVRAEGVLAEDMARRSAVVVAVEALAAVVVAVAAVASAAAVAVVDVVERTGVMTREGDRHADS